MRRKGSLQEWDQLRQIAANMVDQQMEPKEIATILKVDDQTVRQWRRLYLKLGREGLVSGKSTGRPRKLTEEQKQQLVEMIRHEPKEFGMDTFLWTTKLIARLVLEKFGVSHHHDHIGVLLHELGWSPQIPARRAKERDEQRIANWREVTWVEIKKKPRRRRDDYILR
jgi:transposase